MDSKAFVEECTHLDKIFTSLSYVRESMTSWFKFIDLKERIYYIRLLVSEQIMVSVVISNKDKNNRVDVSFNTSFEKDLITDKLVILESKINKSKFIEQFKNILNTFYG